MRPKPEHKLQLDYQLTMEDWVETIRYLSHGPANILESVSKVFGNLVAAPLFLLMLAAPLLVLIITSTAFGFLLVPAILGGGWWFYTRGNRFQQRVRLQLAESLPPEYIGEVRISASPDGLVTGTNEGEEKYDWSEVNLIEETGSRIILGFADNSYWTVPHTAFKIPSEFINFSWRLKRLRGDALGSGEEQTT